MPPTADVWAVPPETLVVSETQTQYVQAEILQNGIGDKNFVQIKMYYVTSRQGGRCVLPRIAVIAN